MLLDPELIIPELDCHSKEEVLTTLGNKLFESGYVKADFVEGILQREKEFPTGLPTIPYGVAIPHTDAERVIQSQIIFATLKNPVKFSMMGNGNQEVDVKIVFMLALNNPQDQLQTLQKLMGMFEVQDLIYQLGQIKNASEFKRLVENIG